MTRVFFSFFFVLFAVSAARAQNSPHSVAVAFSNNGQLAGVSDPFYFRHENMKAVFQPDRIFSEKQAAFKVTLEYSYRTPQHLEFGITGGFGLRKNEYVTDVSRISAAQQYFSVLPFVLRTWEVRSLQFAAGGGIPVYVAGTFRSSCTEQASWTALYVAADNTLAGGTAFGISAVGRIRWCCTPRISLVSTVHFGALYSKFGGDFNVVPTAESDPLYFPKQTRSQSRISVPAPEL